MIFGINNGGPVCVSVCVCVTGLIKRSILSLNVPVLSGPSYYSPLSSGDKNVPPYVISSVKLMLSAFQRQKLENAEEECRRMAKTSHGEHLSILLSPNL